MQNNTPLSNRLHIGIFGRRNAGKSTLINALTNQQVAIVSHLPGTTTDPVYKAMEIHEIGPVVFIDTGGIDDAGTVGSQRVKKAYRVLDKTDIALLVFDAGQTFSDYEEAFLTEVKNRKIPCIVVLNKTDCYNADRAVREFLQRGLPTLSVSALTGEGLEVLRQEIVSRTPEDYERKTILSDIVKPASTVVMVAPLDMEAPKGRLKLPQVQTMRDLLDNNCSVLLVKETQLASTLSDLRQAPALVVTESQIFASVARLVPASIPLTSFSILYARYKGDLNQLVAGAQAIENLNKKDTILIAEACTHHPIDEDIAKVVLPELLLKHLGSGRMPYIEYINGYDFPQDLKKFSLVIHCGGCMLNRREVTYRINRAAAQAVPVTNYGVVIAYLQGILPRAVEPFKSGTSNFMAAEKTEEVSCG